MFGAGAVARLSISLVGAGTILGTPGRLRARGSRQHRAEEE